MYLNRKSRLAPRFSPLYNTMSITRSLPGCASTERTRPCVLSGRPRRPSRSAGWGGRSAGWPYWTRGDSDQKLSLFHNVHTSPSYTSFHCTPKLEAFPEFGQKIDVRFCLNHAIITFHVYRTRKPELSGPILPQIVSVYKPDC